MKGPGAKAPGFSMKDYKKIAFYDLQVSPFSFDFAQFLLCARAAECDKVVIVPGERAYQKCTPGEQEYRLNNLLRGLEPDAHICADRREAEAWWHEGCFPEGYTVAKPVASHTLAHVMKAMRLHPFMASKEMKAAVAADGHCSPNLVTITIRDTHIKPERNSTGAEWVRAADWLRDEGFQVVFIPDTEKPDAAFGNHESSPRAALDVQYRLALYDAACLNLGVNNGPMALCFYSRRPLLYFRPMNGAYPETSLEAWAKAGIAYRSQPPWFTPLQRMIWDGHDDLDTIQEACRTWMRARRGEDAWPASVAPAYPVRGVMDHKMRAGQMTSAMDAAKANGWQMLRRIPAHKKFISVVCYGPSLKETWRYIPRPIMTVSGAHDFLLERGIVPDYHVDCDPREHKIAMLKTPHKDVHYTMATVCHPSAWEKLKGHKVSLWHLHNGPETDEWLKANDPRTPPVGGGTTAGSRALQVASLLGYERFHIFGMDCSYESAEARHAGPHLGKKQNAIEVYTGDGRKFLSSPQMVEAAREMLMMIQNYEIWLYFHGDGLQQHMIRSYRGRFGVVDARDEKAVHLIDKEATHG